MCKICNDFQNINQDAFADNLLDMMNMGALSLMVSIGHRTKLFDTMENMPFASSDEIAGETGLNERYVREWLGALTTGGIIEIDVTGKRFRLPPEHAAFLTRSAGSDNIGVFSQYIATLGSVEDRIVDCFKNGGGVSYDEFNRFHEVMAEDSGQSVLSSLFTDILPLVPGVTSKLESGIDVLDVGCGRGKALIRMAYKYPNSRFYGYDYCMEPIEDAIAEATKLGLKNIYFEQRDLTHYQHERQFDFITAFDAIHDQARPDNILRNIYQALKDGGYFLMQDIDASSNISENMDHPLGPLLYTVSTMHCMTVSLAQNGMGLGTMWGVDTAMEMLKDAGFQKIDIKRLPHDIQNCFFIIQKK